MAEIGNKKDSVVYFDFAAKVITDFGRMTDIYKLKSRSGLELSGTGGVVWGWVV